MKRLLLFLVLLVGGFLVLRLSLGEDQLASADAVGDPVKAPQQPRPTEGGAPIHKHADGTEVRIRGGFVISRPRLVEAPDGRGMIRQQVYELTCADSEPTDDGRHRLIDVSMKLFDRGTHAGNLTASRAVVELQMDANNRRALRENREIELEDAVLETVPGTRLVPMRLTVGRVIAVVTDDLVDLRTPDENEPVTVVVDGDRRGELRGRGLRVRMPKDRDASLGRLDLEILHQPSVTMAGVELHAAGRMHYVEQLATGAALLTVEGDVRVDLTGAGLREGASADAVLGDAQGSGGRRRDVAVRGDRLLGWLQRTRRGEGVRDDALVWTMLRLLGSRASVTTDGAMLESPRLTVVPGPGGEMASITADGGMSELRQDSGASFRSSRPIHLVRVRESLGSLYRSFGFPMWTLGPLADLDVVTFEGAADVDAGNGVRVAADRGLHLFRQQSAAAAGHFVARGRGKVAVVQGEGDERVEAKGDAGFVLWRTAAGDEVAFGRDDPAAAQSYELTRGPLRLRGRGAARVRRSPDGRIEVQLRSDGPTIGGTLRPAAGGGHALAGELRRAQTLDVAVQGRELRHLLATGPETEVTLTRGDETVVATAGRIEQLTPTSMRLHGTDEVPAHLRQPRAAGRAGDLAAPRIDLHLVAARSLLIDAVGGSSMARFEGTFPPAAGRKPAGVVATARRVRLLPFALGPAALRATVTAMPPGLTDVVATSLAQPWLLAEDDVVVDVDDPDQGQLHGEGRLLASSQGSRGLLLVGAAEADRPAVLRRIREGERVLVAEGPRIRFFDHGTERITMLTGYPGHSAVRPPRVTFRGAQDDSGRVEWLQGECRGEIDVIQDAVLFRGPVTAHSLLPSGDVDPDGMHVVAEKLRMTRHPETGQLTKVDAFGGVRVRWRDLSAESSHVELDLRWQRCIAEDPNGAEIRFANGRTYRARRLEANYATYAVRSYFGRLVQEPGDTDQR